MSFSLSFFLFTGIATAVSSRVADPSGCSPNDALQRCLSFEGALATNYCSYILKDAPVTVTTTSTTTATVTVGRTTEQIFTATTVQADKRVATQPDQTGPASLFHPADRPACFNKQAFVRMSAACRCLNVPRRTNTVTATSTATATATTTATVDTCASEAVVNGGFQSGQYPWAFADDPSGAFGSGVRQNGTNYYA
jgi:hypothetical protein